MALHNKPGGRFFGRQDEMRRVGGGERRVGWWMGGGGEEVDATGSYDRVQIAKSVVTGRLVEFTRSDEKKGVYVCFLLCFPLWGLLSLPLLCFFQRQIENRR